MFLKESNDTALLVAYKNSNIKYSIENDKVYSFKVSPYTALVVTLARVQVTARGIDLTNYTSLTKTMAPINVDGDFVITADVFKNDMVDGKYALVITGKDAGVTIPTYFYGPFTFKKYG